MQAAELIFDPRYGHARMTRVLAILEQYPSSEEHAICTRLLDTPEAEVDRVLDELDKRNSHAA